MPHLEIWQFTEDGYAGGITTTVDLDIFSGDYHDFDAFVAEKGIK